MDRMRVTIVYESMYGNTHTIADHIAAGFDDGHFDVVVEPTSLADAAPPSSGLLVVGGPTHAHSLTSSTTRSAAIDAAEKDDGLHVDEHATDVGLRDWLDRLPEGLDLRTAAFDTRADAAALFTGRASKGIAKRLHRRGYDVVDDPVSFLVDKHNHLLDSEVERARAWGRHLASLVMPTA